MPLNCVAGDTTQTRTITITTPCKDQGFCPNGHMHKGVPCPDDETTDCDDKPCEYTWQPWTECLSPPIGNQSRMPSILTLPVGGGTQCPDQQDRPCKVDCNFTWTPWSECDKKTGNQTRTAVISQDSMNGGQACPTKEVRPCAVDCVSKWKGPPNFPDHKDGWGVCGSAGWRRHNRTYVIELSASSQ